MLSKFKKKISNGKKNILKLSSGTMLGHIISLLSLPIITRLYGAEIIGSLTLVLAIASIIKSFSDLGLTNSIMVDDSNNVEKTYKVITTFNIFISTFTSLLVTTYLIKYLNWNYNYVFLFVYLIVIIFTTQQVQVCYTWLNRNTNYNVLMINPLIDQGIFNIIAIILGFFEANLYNYFIAFISGKVSIFIHMRTNLPKGMFTFKLEDYRFTIKNNKRFVFYQIPTNILMNLKNQTPTLVIHNFWGSEMLGYYSIAIKVLQVPSSLLASAIGRVFFQKISSMHLMGESIGEYVNNSMKSAMRIAAVPMIILTAFADIGLMIILGEDWKISGEFIRFLSIMYFFIFLMNATQGLAITLEKQNFTMILSIFQIMGCYLGAYVGKIIFDNIYISLLLMSLFYVIVQIFYFAALFKCMDISRLKYIKSVISSVLTIVILSVILRWLMDISPLIQFFS